MRAALSGGVVGSCTATPSTPSHPLAEGLEAHTPPTPSRPLKGEGVVVVPRRRAVAGVPVVRPRVRGSLWPVRPPTRRRKS